MTFELDNSIFIYLKEQECDIDVFDDVIMAIEHLANACYEKKHMLIASYKQLKFLSEYSIFNERTKVILKNISNFSAEFYSYKNLRRRIILKENTSSITKNQDDVQMLLEVPIRYLVESSLLNSSILLCEAINDYKIFVEIARQHRKSNKIYIGNSIEFENGGGQNTDKVYKQRLDTRNRLCLVITDSDKRYCKDDFGGVWRGLEKIKDFDFMSEKYCLPIRTVENLFPVKLIRILSENSKGLENLEKIEESVYAHHLSFFYYREGLKKEIKDKNSEVILNKWNNICKELCLFDTDIESLVKAKNHEDCCFISGVKTPADKYVNNLENRYSKQDPFLFDFTYSPPEYLKKYYNSISELINAWGASFPGTLKSR